MIFDTQTGKILRLKPRNQRIHYFSQFFAKTTQSSFFSNFQLAQHWPRITLEPIQEYALRVNTTQENARERPGTSRGSPGTSAQQPLKTHENYNFIDPGSDQIRIDFPLLFMLISITETSSEHDFWYSNGKNSQIETSATTNSLLFNIFRKILQKVIIFQTFN